MEFVSIFCQTISSSITLIILKYLKDYYNARLIHELVHMITIKGDKWNYLYYSNEMNLCL